MWGVLVYIIVVFSCGIRDASDFEINEDNKQTITMLTMTLMII